MILSKLSIKVNILNIKALQNPRRRPLISSIHLAKFNLNLALHRFLTFPADYQRRTGLKRENLANSGIYISHCKNSLFCHFCPFEITSLRDWKGLNADEINKKHLEVSPGCPLFTRETANVPLDSTGCLLSNQFEACRLFSLLVIDWRSYISVYELAHSGFYYAGDEDNVRCAFCKLEVRGWEEIDTADGEHRRWSPNCLFLLGKQVRNVAIGEELTVASACQEENPFIKSSNFRKYSNNLQVFCSRWNLTLEKLAIVEATAPKFCSFVYYDNRLKSFFDKWPQSLAQKPTELASAGFFYTGIGDRVICFHCGLGLKDWAPQDHPWQEHIQWNPSCTYIHKMKVKQTIAEVLHTSKNLPQNIATGTEGDNSAVRLHKQDFICENCKLDEINTVNLPCGHMENCLNCTSAISICKACEQPILASLKVYLN